MFENEKESSPLVKMEDFKTWILYEDDHVLVLNKPGWLVCHPSKNGPWSSLVGATKEYLGVESIHLASRLDRETSGVVLLAKHRKAASYWQKGIEYKKVKRRYLAIVRGEMTKEIKVSNFLGNDPTSNVFVKQRVLEQKTNKAKKAETFFTPLLVQHGHTFCRVRTLTGRKHQIRVHAQWIGHPLVGEKLYGADENIYLRFCEKGWQPEWMKDLGMRRQALHGEWLGFDEGEGCSYSATLPGDMSVYLQENLKVLESELNTLLT
jgi:23S rRNA pseudouridine1911/1915/1917 synthase